MKKHLVMEGENQAEAIEQLQQEVNAIMATNPPTKAMRAFNVFFGTLARMCDGIFDYLPPQQRGEIASACGAWCNLGMAYGQDPQILVRIMERINPQLCEVDYPTWLTQSLEEPGRDPPEPE